MNALLVHGFSFLALHECTLGACMHYSCCRWMHFRCMHGVFLLSMMTLMLMMMRMMRMSTMQTTILMDDDWLLSHQCILFRGRLNSLLMTSRLVEHSNGVAPSINYNQKKYQISKINSKECSMAQASAFHNPSACARQTSPSQPIHFTYAQRDDLPRCLSTEGWIISRVGLIMAMMPWTHTNRQQTHACPRHGTNATQKQTLAQDMGQAR